MAYSFFTREELPYLLDLHLLLSRTVVPAPSVPLLQAAEAASSLSASASVFGMVPQVRDPYHFKGPMTGLIRGFVPAYALLSRCLRSAEDLPFSLLVWLQAPVEDAAERVRATIAGAPDLQAQQRSCSNAWDLYRRTRPAASPESAARARTLGLPGPHPLLAAACPTYTQGDRQAQVVYPALSTCYSASSEVMPLPIGLNAMQASPSPAVQHAPVPLQEKAADLRAKLRSYRPSATVLEAELAPARLGDGAGTLAGPGMGGAQVQDPMLLSPPSALPSPVPGYS